MTQDTRIALLLMGQLINALRANDPDTFKQWLYGGIQGLGEPAVTELLLDWIDPFQMMDKISLGNTSDEGVDSQLERRCSSSST